MADLKFADSHNSACHLADPPAAYSILKSMVFGLNHCRISFALHTNPTIHKDLILDSWRNASIIKNSNNAEEIKSTVRGISVSITKQTIREILKFEDSPEFPIEFPADRIREILARMGYESLYPSTLKKLLPPYWRLLFHVFVT